jgi:hypothetical protein
MELYEVESLEKARKFLLFNETKVILTNPQGSTRYYGMRTVDHIFNILKQEFPDKIKDIVVNAYDDYSAFVTARKLGYEQIHYFNRAA